MIHLQNIYKICFTDSHLKYKTCLQPCLEIRLSVEIIVDGPVEAKEHGVDREVPPVGIQLPVLSVCMQNVGD